MIAEERLVSALTMAVAETIENMAFSEAIVQGTKNCLPASQKGGRKVLLPVYRPVRGMLFMVLDQRLLQSLMENIYGMAGEIDMDVEKDTMAEILNTMAGKFMNLLTSPDEQFQIGLPAPDQEPGAVENLPVITCIFDIDGDCLMLSFIG